MRKEDVKKGVLVVDRGYQDMGTGTIVEVLTTVFKVEFRKGVETYDYPHAKFLDIVKKDCSCIGDCCYSILNNVYYNCIEKNNGIERNKD